MFAHDFVGNFTLIKTNWPCQTVIQFVVANLLSMRYHKADIFYAFASISFLLKPEFPLQNKKKRRLITAAYLSSELHDLLLHIYKDMDKSSAARVKKSDSSFQIFSLHVFLKYFFSQNVSSPVCHYTHIITWCKRNVLKKKKQKNYCAAFFYFTSIHRMKMQTQIFIFESTCKSNLGWDMGAALQPLKTTPEPELLRWASLGQALVK